MRKKVLFSACALAACFAACTNDDFQSTVEGNNNQVATEIGETVGADLVSKGMTMTIQNGEADTRMTDTGSFSEGDIVGLAAYNLRKTGEYGQTQNRSTWEANTDNGDKVIYNIPSFETEDGYNWTTMANIYQGAYYAYYPWTRDGFQREMTITPNEPYQTGAFGDDRYANRFQISAQDFIEAGEGINSSTGELKWDFCLISPLNQFAVVPNPNDYITTNDYLKAMYITSMTVKTNASAPVIVTKGTVYPQRIPHVIRTVEGDINATATRTAMYDALESMDATTSYITYISKDLADEITTSMGAEGSESTYFTLVGGKNLHQIRVFMFPIIKALQFDAYDYRPSVEFVVKGKEGPWPLGTFTVDRDQAASATLIDNLKKMFSDDAKWSMTKILLNDKGNPKALSSADEMSAYLTPQNFAPAVDNITGASQWTDLVNLIDALTGEGGKYQSGDKVTFTLGGDVDFRGDIPTPKNGVEIVLATGPHTLTIKGTSNWPANLITDKEDNITVDQNAVLNIGMDEDADDTNDPEVTVYASITNLGTINAGGNAVISNGTDKSLDNSDSNAMVVIRYGALVYPADKQHGVIAYRVADTEPATIGKVNTLIETEVNSGQNVNYAHVNTLIIALSEEGVFDLNADATPTSGDNYNPSQERQLRNLTDIDIRLEGGKVAYTGGKYVKVNNVYNVSGNGTIQDIEPQGNIEVWGGQLSINTDAAVLYNPNGKDLELNYGSTVELRADTRLDVNTDIYTTYVVNASGATIDLSDAVIYLPTRNNYSHNNGTLSGGDLQIVGASQADAVKESFNALRKAGYGESDMTSFLTAMNGDAIKYANDATHKDEMIAASYVGFYNRFNAWLEVIGRVPYDKTKGEKITAADLTTFEEMMGTTFVW